MSEVGTQLRAVRDLIALEDQWTKGAMARDKAGWRVDPRASNACCWCLTGAIEARARTNLLLNETVNILRKTVFILGLGMSLTDVNDTLGHAAVLRLLDAAIERAEGGCECA